MGAILIQQAPHDSSLHDRVSGDLRRAHDVGEVSGVLAGWIRADVEPDAFVALAQPDAVGRLRVVWKARGGPGVERRRSELRRAVFESKRSARVRYRDGSDRTLVMFPVTSAGRAIGVLEVAASQTAIDASWEALVDMTDVLGRHLDRLDRRSHFRHRHDTLEPSPSPGRGLVEAGAPGRGVDVAPRAGWGNDQLEWGIAVMAHEIRGPLLGVRAVLEIVLQRPTADPGDVDILQRSVRELDQLAVTAEDLLAWAAGARSLRPRPADVVQVVDEAVASCRLETGEDRVVVFAPTSAPARVDPPQLRSAIVNLLRNALAYADPGTKVEVTVHEEGDVVLLSVKDEGPAIPLADRERIFDPFVRGSREGRIGNRAGLGLFITRRVIEDHGGRIWVESDLSGTTFHVMLPVDERRGQRFAS